MAQTKRGFLAPPEGGMLSHRALLMLFFPLVIEALVGNVLSVLDTMLASALCDEATAGVSYSATICTVVTNFLSGMAAGGSIITAQFFGRRRSDHASDAARASLIGCLLFAAIAACMAIAPRAAIVFLMGEVDESILHYSVEYFTVATLGFPASALFYVGTATYRAQGDTKIPMLVTGVNVGMSLMLKLIFTRLLDLGIFGMALSNTLGVVIAVTVMFVLMTVRKPAVSFRCSEDAKRIDLRMILRSMRVSIPAAIESASVGLGLMFIQRMIAGFGLIDSAAHGIGIRLQILSYFPASCWGTVSMIAVSQHCGAGQPELARKYTVYLTKLSYIWNLSVNIVLLFLLDRIIGFFGGSPEVLALAKKLMVLYTCFDMVLYPLAYGLPQALRGAGDTFYVMLVSLTVMFALRIGLAYVFGEMMHLGAFGAWIAMVCDWALRAILYAARFFSGKWLERHLVQ